MKQGIQLISRSEYVTQSVWDGKSDKYNQFYCEPGIIEVHPTLASFLLRDAPENFLTLETPVETLTRINKHIHRII